jgi:hypothetical protein
MTFLSYSLQSGLGLALTYVFYRVCLVRLTFYKANRLYLSAGIGISLLAPLVDTSGLWPQKVERFSVYVQGSPGADTPVVHTPAAPVPLQHLPVLEYILLVGMLLMAARLLIQVFSLLRLRRKAVPAGERGRIRFFMLPYPLAPFSFGHSIFFHPSAQASAEFGRIVDHETAHIEGRHTMDIVLSQLLLILQWWNPAAWLLDRVIRQNLEYMADQAVLDRGADPRQYQYLLLRVSGLAVPALSNPFNFSPLKNRIAMMNKQRSGRTQGVRFLALLPLLILLLVAASRHHATPSHQQAAFRLYAFVVDGATLKPLADATVTEQVSGLTTKTDGDGFFMMDIPTPPEGTDTLKMHAVVSKAGFDSFQDIFQTSMKNLGTSNNAGADLQLIGLAGDEKDRRGFSNSSIIFPNEEEGLRQNGSPGRKEAFQKLVNDAFGQREVEAKLAAAPDQIYFVINGQAYVATHGSWASLGLPANLVLVDGKTRMTGEEVNKTYKRSQLKGWVSAVDADKAKTEYGIDENLFVIRLKTQP